MKKNVLSLVLMAFGMISFMQVNAQTMVTGGIDSVAVGSQVNYEVTPDANIAAMVTAGALDASQFDWQIVSGNGTINTASNGGGVDLFPPAIDLTWNATGNAQVSVAESSVKDDAVLCADATPELLNVVVLPLPTFTTDGGNDGSCNAQDYTIPLTLTGYGPWEVSYSISYDDLSGGGATSADFTKTLGAVADNVGTTATDIDLAIVAASELNKGTGTYEITITSIDDRFTGKAQNAIDGVLATGGNSGYTLYVFPTPVTSPIQHIEN